MPITRNLQHLILSDLGQYEQMLFVSGPRQSGKTTLAEMILDQVGIGRYWNNDIPEDQILLAKKPSLVGKTSSRGLMTGPGRNSAY
jgi:predicted AAA+ superfamily ATPase